MTIGKRIQEVRRWAGLKQAELAEITGLAVITIGQYERDKRQPRIEQLQALAVALKVPLNLLIGLQPYPDIVFEDKYRVLILDAIYVQWGELPSLGDVRNLGKIDYLRLIGTICAEISLTGPQELSIFYKTESPESDKKTHPAWYSRIYMAMSKLNPIGQIKAIEHVEELTEIPKYQCETKKKIKKAPTEGKDSTQDN